MEATNEKKADPTEPAAKSGYSGAKPSRNEILSLIPESESELIRSDLEAAALRRDFILHDAGERIDFTHFLTNRARFAGGADQRRPREVAVIRREGGVGALLHRRLYRAIMQIPGNEVRIPADRLEEKLRKMPVLRALLNRYVLVPADRTDRRLQLPPRNRSETRPLAAAVPRAG